MLKISVDKQSFTAEDLEVNMESKGRCNISNISSNSIRIGSLLSDGVEA